MTLKKKYHKAINQLAEAQRQVNAATKAIDDIERQLRQTVEYRRVGWTTTLKKGNRTLKLTYQVRGWCIKENGRVIYPQRSYDGVNQIRLGFALGEF